MVNACPSPALILRELQRVGRPRGARPVSRRIASPSPEGVSRISKHDGHKQSMLRATGPTAHRARPKLHALQTAHRSGNGARSATLGIMNLRRIYTLPPIERSNTAPILCCSASSDIRRLVTSREFPPTDFVVPEVIRQRAEVGDAEPIVLYVESPVDNNVGYVNAFGRTVSDIAGMKDVTVGYGRKVQARTVVS